MRVRERHDQSAEKREVESHDQKQGTGTKGAIGEVPISECGRSLGCRRDARLPNASPQPEVHISVDKFSKYEAVAQALADLQHHGLKKIGFVNNDLF